MKKAIRILLGVIVLAALAAGAYFGGRYLLDSMGGTPEDGGVDPNEALVAETNAEIVRALADFSMFAQDGAVLPSEVCMSGFINNFNVELVNFSERLVQNRILSLDPIEYATTQDEAGIVCASATGAWALALPLNTLGENAAPAYHCIDSAGANGMMWVNPETATCVAQ